MKRESYTGKPRRPYAIDPDAYGVVKLLRNKVLNAEALGAQTDISAENMNKLIKRFRRAKLIIQDKDDGLFLVANSTVVTVYPKYLISVNYALQ